MAAHSSRVLTLLDPEDEHGWCDTQFNSKIFIRFTDYSFCREHIDVQVASDQMDIHFFFPDTQLELIMNWPPDHRSSHNYIYCRDEASIQEIIGLYGDRIATKIFLVEDLEFQIYHVEIALLHALIKQEPNESYHRDIMVSNAVEHAECLAFMLRKMIDQIGVQPLEP